MVPRILSSTIGLFVAAALVAGCSGGGSSRGGPLPSSTTAGATSGTGGTTTAATQPGNAALHAAPATAGNPLDAYNADLQVVWDELRPLAIDQLSQLVQTDLQGQTFQQGRAEIEVLEAKLGAIDMQLAPGVVQLDRSGLRLRLPVRDTWSLELETRLRARVKVGPFSPRVTLPVTIKLKEVNVELGLTFDNSDPTRPQLQRVGQPQLDFKVELSSPNVLVRQLAKVLSKPADRFAQQALSSALAKLTPALGALSGIPGAVPADGAAPLIDSGAATPFEQVALGVERKIEAVNQPHGVLLKAQMDTPSQVSWLDAYGPNGVGVEGTVVSHHRGHDGAIWTGQYLGAEAMRYAVTQTPEALAAVTRTLEGVGHLLDVNGGTGLLARAAHPETSTAGQEVVQRGQVFRRAQINGQTWVGYQGTVGITRDQYSGVMFGLGATFEHVPPLRNEAARRIQQILDYLEARRWLITEDRPVFNGQNGSRGPLFWAGASYQKLAYLLIGHQTDPTRYAQSLAQAGAHAETAWFTAWVAALNVDQYYKFNLNHVNSYSYFRLETDLTRWQAMRRADQIIERYVGHHRNAHFDLIRSSYVPSLQPVAHGGVREALRQFLQTPHRAVALPTIDLSGVTYDTFTTVGYTNTSGGGVQIVTTTQQLPTEPLHPILRKPANDFVWQRDPFTPASPNQGDAEREKSGLDVVLPYWMGRLHGAF